jgi:hypothetical protein
MLFACMGQGRKTPASIWMQMSTFNCIHHILTVNTAAFAQDCPSKSFYPPPPAHGPHPGCSIIVLLATTATIGLVMAAAGLSYHLCICLPSAGAASHWHYGQACRVPLPLQPARPQGLSTTPVNTAAGQCCRRLGQLTTTVTYSKRRAREFMHI